MKTIARLVACLAWSAVPVSMAASVSANGISAQPPANYCTCGPNHTASSWYYCNVQWNYTQSIRFISTACSGGACSNDGSSFSVESVYPTGRKTASQVNTCLPSPYVIYSLGSCAC